MATKKIMLNELQTLVKTLLKENDDMEAKRAEIYVNRLIELYGDDYKTIHKVIERNIVNNKYEHISNDFVQCVWNAVNKKFFPESNPFKKETVNEYGEDSGAQDMTWGMYNRDNYVAPPISTNPYAVAKEIKDELPDVFNEDMVEKIVDKYFIENDLNQKKLQDDSFWEDLYYALTEDFGKKLGYPTGIQEDYPTGSQYDSDAPWNQGLDPDYEDFEVVQDADNIDDFAVRLRDSNGGTTNVIYLSYILQETNASPEEYQYFESALSQNPRPPSFTKKLDMLIDDYSDIAEFVNEPDMDEDLKYNPNDY